MTSADYAAQRLDPRWQQKRLRVMERDGFKCVDCGDGKKTLNVHHDYYVTGRMPWSYPMFSLNTLCRDCHKERHGELDDGGERGASEWEEALEFMLGENPALSSTLWTIGACLAWAAAPGPGASYSMPEMLRSLEDKANAIRRASDLGVTYKEVL